jgi:glycosyltransferase involved in cell wall biosynthesis
MHIGIIGPIYSADIEHLIDDNFGALPKGYSGAPFLATLIAELLGRGHRVSAFTLSNDMPLKPEMSVTVTGKNFTLTYCPMRPRAWRPNGCHPGRIVDLYRFESVAMHRAIMREAPDVIHAHWAYEFALAAIATKIPHVITCHDSPFAIARLNIFNRPTISAYRCLRVLMAQKALSKAKYLTTVSPYMQNEIQRHASARVVVVPNPVDRLAFLSASARTAPPAPRLVMVCNGWDARKNPAQALRAFTELRSDLPAIELHLYGRDFGPGEKAEAWCAKRGFCKGIVFHGAVAHQQLLRLLADFDLLLHPSIEESFGMVIAEAMAMGIPVVAGSSSGAVPWVVGNGGVLCDVRRHEDIVLAIHKALNPVNYVRYSFAARERVSTNFTASAVASAYLITYENAIRGNIV